MKMSEKLVFTKLLKMASPEDTIVGGRGVYTDRTSENKTFLLENWGFSDPFYHLVTSTQLNCPNDFVFSLARKNICNSTF